jgi:hypothetical protein
MEQAMKMSKDERWSTYMARIGNEAVRDAQARNRQLGIPNWYSLNGRLVSDAAADTSAAAKEAAPASPPAI